jgi:hypothetical protein
MITVRTFFRAESKRYVDPAAPVRKIAKDSLDPADYAELPRDEKHLVSAERAAAILVECELGFSSKAGATATRVSIVNPELHALTVFDGPEAEIVQLIHVLRIRPRMVLDSPPGAMRGVVRLKAAKHPLPPESYEVPPAKQTLFGASDFV